MSRPAAYREPVPTEHAEQCAVIEWANLQAGAYPELRWLYAVPNGGERHPAVANKLRAEGVKPGVPDLALDLPRQGYHGLKIEMKRQRAGRLPPEQGEWIDHYNEIGYLAVACLGADDAIAVLCDYLGITERGF